MAFATLWLLCALAFESPKLSLIILIPFLLIFLCFFDAETNSKGAGYFWNSFKGFGLKSNLVFLSYFGYRYVIKNERIENNTLMILVGWLAFFLFCQISPIVLDTFNIKRFESMAYVNSFIYFFWLIILISRWRKGIKHGALV